MKMGEMSFICSYSCQVVIAAQSEDTEAALLMVALAEDMEVCLNSE
jgi:hypothetical protein